MSFKLLSQFYGAGSALSNPAPPERQIIDLHDSSPEFITKLEQRAPLYFGTVTLDPKLYGMLSQDNQIDLILKFMKLYIKTLSKKDTLVWVLEFHKDHRPHIHMISTGFQKNFRDTFKPLGSRNAHKDSYQITIYPLVAFKYLCKFDAIYNEKRGIKMIEVINNTINLTVNIRVNYNSTSDPVRGRTHTPRCSWLPPDTEDTSVPRCLHSKE